MRITSCGDCNEQFGFEDGKERRFPTAGTIWKSPFLERRGNARFQTLMDALYLVGVAVVAVFAFVFAIILFNFFGIWLRARIANAPVGMGKMIGMRLRRVPVGMIVDNRITAVKAGLEVPSDPLEAHFLAGGDVSQVILALIAADKAGISLDFNRACAIDLATKGTGKTVLEAVRTSINPKVIDVPNPSMGRTTIDGVAKDGIGAKVKARVTVRSHLDRFVGGATEETIIARVGEGIVSAIGSADSYKDVLENPDRISKAVLAKGLDSNTAFEILSIDIADVDVGDNIGAKLQSSGESRSAPRRRGRRRTGNARQDAGDARESRRSRSTCAASHGRCLSLGQSRHHGLCAHEKCAGRHVDARVDCWQR
jgi:uncharacterized protein YqfA (UPF0365 family)